MTEAGTTILLVEDDATLRHTLALNLRAEGHRVLEAEAGKRIRAVKTFPLSEPFLTGHYARAPRRTRLFLKTSRCVTTAPPLPITTSTAPEARPASTAF